MIRENWAHRRKDYISFLEKKKWKIHTEPTMNEKLMSLWTISNRFHFKNTKKKKNVTLLLFKFFLTIQNSYRRHIFLSASILLITEKNAEFFKRVKKKFISKQNKKKIALNNEIIKFLYASYQILNFFFSFNKVISINIVKDLNFQVLSCEFYLHFIQFYVHQVKKKRKTQSEKVVFTLISSNQMNVVKISYENSYVKSGNNISIFKSINPMKMSLFHWISVLQFGIFLKFDPILVPSGKDNIECCCYCLCSFVNQTKEEKKCKQTKKKCLCTQNAECINQNWLGASSGDGMSTNNSCIFNQSVNIYSS